MRWSPMVAVLAIAICGWGTARPAVSAAMLATEGVLGDADALARQVWFSGGDIWRLGAFVHGGMLYSPAGLGREGLTFKLLLSEGRYAYWSGGWPVIGQQFLAAALAGWRIKRGPLTATILAGFDLQKHWLWPDDPENALRGLHIGPHLGLDLWLQPNRHVMANGALSLSGAGESFAARAALGLRVCECFWFGPEVSAQGDPHYHQARLGLHVTGWRRGRFDWSAGGGWARDSSDRGGYYLRIGAVMRR